MAKTDRSAALAAPTFPPLTGREGTASLMAGLFERSRPSLTDADLATCTQQAQLAGLVVEQIRALSEKLGLLVQADGAAGRGRTGVLADEADVANVLFGIANLADHASGLLGLAENARDEINARQDREASHA